MVRYDHKQGTTMKKNMLIVTLTTFAFANQTAKIKPENILSTDRATRDINQIRSEGLEYLNLMRQTAGMTTYKQNTFLDTSAQNHANYLLLNNYGISHYESSSDSGFTGITWSDRAFYAGYQSGVGENLTYASAGQSVQKSIDNLFSAIYHRIGFLNFSWDEVGVGASSGEIHHVFNMGNSLINDLCAGESFSGNGTYVYSVCSDSNFLIEVDTYAQAENANKAANPEIVIWPAENQTDVLPVFFEESPDPLPDYSVSGYPVSLHFNDYYTTDVSLNSLELFDSQGNLIDNVRLLDESSDPNSKFSSHDFTLFPLERLEWGSTYTAKASYTADGVDTQKEWSFTTKKPDYPYYIASNTGETFEVQSGLTYAFYIPPRNQYDSSKPLTWQYDYGFNINDSGLVDFNTPYFAISGSTGKSATVTLGSTKFTMVLSDKDNAISNATPDATLTLQTGWNLMALPVNQTHYSTSNLGSNSAVWGYKNGTWSYQPSIIEAGMGYWVHASQNQTLEFTGEAYSPNLDGLAAGWHLLGTGENIDLSTYTFQAAWSYADGEWTTFPTVQAGQGFWAKP